MGKLLKWNQNLKSPKNKVSKFYEKFIKLGVTEQKEFFYTLVLLDVISIILYNLDAFFIFFISLDENLKGIAINSKSLRRT